MDNNRGYLIIFFTIIIILTSAAADTKKPADTIDQGNKQNLDLEASAAAQRGDYAVAYSIWHPLAVQGDAEAEYALGWMYHNGYGLVTNDLAARAWWEKAVAQGYPDAMFSLGTLYSMGSNSIERDYPAAIRLWLRAAAEGHENARFALRELVQRDLPELSALKRTLRDKYPQFLGEPTSFTNRMRSSNYSGNDRVVNNKTEGSLEGFVHSSELISVMAGHRPEYGWAATQLYKEGTRFIAGNRW